MSLKTQVFPNMKHLFFFFLSYCALDKHTYGQSQVPKLSLYLQWNWKVSQHEVKTVIHTHTHTHTHTYIYIYFFFFGQGGCFVFLCRERKTIKLDFVKDCLYNISFLGLEWRSHESSKVFLLIHSLLLKGNLGTIRSVKSSCLSKNIHDNSWKMTFFSSGIKTKWFFFPHSPSADNHRW